MITYYLVAGLLEIGDKCPQIYENVADTLWAYARFIIQLIPENGKKKRWCFLKTLLTDRFESQLNLPSPSYFHHSLAFLEQFNFHLSFIVPANFCLYAKTSNPYSTMTPWTWFVSRSRPVSRMPKTTLIVDVY